MQIKKFILGLTLCMLTTFVFAQETKPVDGKSFGEGVTQGNIQPVAKMETAMGDKKAADMKITGEVVEVCKKKGCWMTLKMPEGESIRVTFKDYAFFMPMDIVGKKVALDGIAKKQTISVETLRHYAEDAHKPAAEVAKITEPKKELAFEAKGVVILN
ncbi:DUF4920 domain-containing protein [Pedobacter metabolipauper]|uniref:Uncharacterized protein DUF4920 n=1 Tax=Pedobacter metabolipauper TaxID=425513 RepID=A0A4R6SY26_9SPHI|nr:DUF4920 domain-containing protein [Pedobacter metabolipauper]TDQ09385.1 uncharacterized protein DUF4920 [Pedobacter metabolipauper]